jgi:hypothetical protein
MRGVVSFILQPLYPSVSSEEEAGWAKELFWIKW